MNYDIAIVNPKTSEERTITVELSADQIDAANVSQCFQSHIQTLARANIPVGFMPIGNGVRRGVLQ